VKSIKLEQVSSYREINVLELLEILRTLLKKNMHIIPLLT
jgi:hypothetical protein